MIRFSDNCILCQEGRRPVQTVHGLINSKPIPSKFLRFLVANAAPEALAMPAMRRSLISTGRPKALRAAASDAAREAALVLNGMILFSSSEWSKSSTAVLSVSRRFPEGRMLTPYWSSKALTLVVQIEMRGNASSQTKTFLSGDFEINSESMFVSRIIMLQRDSSDQNPSTP